MIRSSVCMNDFETTQSRETKNIGHLLKSGNNYVHFAHYSHMVYIYAYCQRVDVHKTQNGPNVASTKANRHWVITSRCVTYRSMNLNTFLFTYCDFSKIIHLHQRSKHQGRQSAPTNGQLKSVGFRARSPFRGIVQ